MQRLEERKDYQAFKELGDLYRLMPTGESQEMKAVLREGLNRLAIDEGREFAVHIGGSLAVDQFCIQGIEKSDVDIAGCAWTAGGAVSVPRLKEGLRDCLPVELRDIEINFLNEYGLYDLPQMTKTLHSISKDECDMLPRIRWLNGVLMLNNGLIDTGFVLEDEERIVQLGKEKFGSEFVETSQEFDDWLPVYKKSYEKYRERLVSRLRFGASRTEKWVNFLNRVKMLESQLY